MSRLGDQIRQVRIQKGIDRKKLAKKAGIADKVLQEVEEGRRIPTDDQAARILKLLGAKNDLSEAFSPAVGVNGEDVPVSPAPRPVRKAAKPAPAPSQVQPNEQWGHALAGLMHDVPVLNIRGEQVAKRTFVLEKGRIYGQEPGEVLYLQMPDDLLAKDGIHEKDLLFMVRDTTPRVNTLCWVRIGSHDVIGRLKKNGATWTISGLNLDPQTFRVVARALFAEITV